MSSTVSVAVVLATGLAGHLVVPTSTRLADYFGPASPAAVASHDSSSQYGPEASSGPELEPQAARGAVQDFVVRSVDGSGYLFWAIILVILGHVVGFWACTVSRCSRGQQEEVRPGGRAVRSRISENGRARRPVHR